MTATQTEPQVEELGQRDWTRSAPRVVADLGDRGRDYIRNVIKTQRGLEVAGRGAAVPRLPAARLARRHRRPVAVEDPRQHGDRPQRHARPVRLDARPGAQLGKTFEWDTACPADQWRHSHNYIHHTYTNIIGKDRDIGYGVLRMSEDQPWALLPRPTRCGRSC